jgi:ParB-like chromosome segregation protein Spo0J
MQIEKVISEHEFTIRRPPVEGVDKRDDYGFLHLERLIAVFDELPPITVWKDEDGRWLLLDGQYRLEAAKRLGHTEIKVAIFKGSREKAIEFACLANAKRGQPLGCKTLRNGRQVADTKALIKAQMHLERVSR